MYSHILVKTITKPIFKQSGGIILITKPTMHKQVITYLDEGNNNHNLTKTHFHQTQLDNIKIKTHNAQISQPLS